MGSCGTLCLILSSQQGIKTGGQLWGVVSYTEQPARNKDGWAVVGRCVLY